MGFQRIGLPRHRARLDAAEKAVAHNYICTGAQFLNKQIKVAEIITVVGIAHYAKLSVRIGSSNSGLARTASQIAMGHQIEMTLLGETSGPFCNMARNVVGGSQCTSGSTVWNSTGKPRFGVVTNNVLRVTRHNSFKNWAWFAWLPTCSRTALEWT